MQNPEIPGFHLKAGQKWQADPSVVRNRHTIERGHMKRCVKRSQCADQGQCRTGEQATIGLYRVFIDTFGKNGAGLLGMQIGHGAFLWWRDWAQDGQLSRIVKPV